MGRIMKKMFIYCPQDCAKNFPTIPSTYMEKNHLYRNRMKKS